MLASSLITLREGLEADGVELQECGLWWIPAASVPIEGKEAESLLALVEILEDHDDVQNVHANFEISDAEWERIAAL